MTDKQELLGATDGQIEMFAQQKTSQEMNDEELDGADWQDGFDMAIEIGRRVVISLHQKDAEIEELSASGWRDIESAPKDGSRIWVEGGIAYWNTLDKTWYTITAERWPGKPIQWDVTHWMPLPSPPTGE